MRVTQQRHLCPEEPFIFSSISKRHKMCRTRNSLPEVTCGSSGGSRDSFRSLVTRIAIFLPMKKTCAPPKIRVNNLPVLSESFNWVTTRRLGRNIPAGIIRLIVISSCQFSLQFVGRFEKTLFIHSELRSVRLNASFAYGWQPSITLMLLLFSGYTATVQDEPHAE